MQAIAAFRPARRAWLGVIALCHLAALMAWRPAVHSPAEAEARREGELVFLRAPRAMPRIVPPAPAAAPTVAARRVAPPPPVTHSATAPPASSAEPAVADAITLPATADVPPDPFATPAPAPALDTLGKARLAAAGVDRQLRKESLNKFATIILPDTKLGMAIARSQKKDWVLEQTSTSGDGVVMKRYRRGNMEYCEYTNLVGARGQDPFRDGNKTKVMTCP